MGERDGQQKPAGAFSDPDLLRRIMSAAVLVPVAVFVAWMGGWAFSIFWLLAAVAVLREWNRLVQNEQSPVLFAAEIAVLAAAVVAVHLARNPAVAAFALAVGVALTFVMAPTGQRRWSATGVLYAAAVVTGPVILRDDPVFGFAAILWLFAVVWGADVAAYFAGRTFGGPKLWPRLSPKKTWSGFVGGLCAGVGLGLCIASVVGVPPSVGLALVSGAIAATSQAGDLFESFVKRRFDAKDAGTLIPGHGGVMDRLDGFLVAGIAAALFGLARGGIDAPAAGVLLW